MSLTAPEYCILCGLPTYGAACQQVFCGKLHETRAAAGYSECATVADGIAEQNRAIYERMTAAETELAEWRRGARRIYWRVQGTGESLYKTSCRAHKGARKFCHDLVKLEAGRGTVVSVRRMRVKPRGSK